MYSLPSLYVDGCLYSGTGHIASHNGVHQVAGRRLSSEDEIAFKLLHINDQHSHVEGIQASGQLCTEKDEVRNERQVCAKHEVLSTCAA